MPLPVPVNLCVLQAYHKANEERKQYLAEITAAKGAIEHLRTSNMAANSSPRLVSTTSPYQSIAQRPVSLKLLNWYEM
jgi:hypothetical protein